MYKLGLYQGTAYIAVDLRVAMATGLEVHEACTMGDFDSLEEYLRSGKYDVNMKDPEWQNRSPLHWACAKGGYNIDGSLVATTRRCCGQAYWRL